MWMDTKHGVSDFAARILNSPKERGVRRGITFPCQNGQDPGRAIGPTTTPSFVGFPVAAHPRDHLTSSVPQSGQGHIGALQHGSDGQQRFNHIQVWSNRVASPNASTAPGPNRPYAMHATPPVTVYLHRSLWI
jgi:hypothetical protein